MSTNTSTSLYHYDPSIVGPAMFAALIGTSLSIHCWQTYYYRSWRVTFFMLWGGLVFTSGWIMRIFSARDTSNLDLYISQNVLVLAGPPIYAAAEYAILSRLMHYLPYHAPLHPHRVLTFFIYLGAAVESLTAAGASTIAANPGDLNKYKLGNTLLSVSLVLQGAVECVFIYLVALVHQRCAQAGKVPTNVRMVAIMLYGTSALILLRSIFRAVESFGTSDLARCNHLCHFLRDNEWYLYVFEGAPMVLYTYWLNIIHPGRLLPRQRQVFRDIDGYTERFGPGWIDRRSTYQTFLDPYDLVGILRSQPSHEKFWEGSASDQWPIVEGRGTKHVKGKSYTGLHQEELDMTSKLPSKA